MRIAPRNPVCPTVCRKGFGADEAVPPQCRSRSLDNISSSDIVAFMGTPNPREFLPLPPTQFHILVALSAGELHGYAIMQAVESSSDRLVKIGPATLYGTLKRLVDDGLAEEVAKPPSPGDDARRRYYRLTGLGGRVCAAEAQRLAALVKVAHANLAPGVA